MNSASMKYAQQIMYTSEQTSSIQVQDHKGKYGQSSSTVKTQANENSVTCTIINTVKNMDVKVYMEQYYSSIKWPT